MVLPTLDPRFNKVLTRAVPIGVAEDILQICTDNSALSDTRRILKSW